MQFGVEIETDLRMKESTATFGYQYDIPKANATLKGMKKYLFYKKYFSIILS